MTPATTVYVIESHDWITVWTENGPEPSLEGCPMLLRKAAERLVTEFDGLTCESVACANKSNPVGWILTEYEDSYGRDVERQEFRYTALVVEANGRVWLACEDCHAAFSPNSVTP